MKNISRRKKELKKGGLRGIEFEALLPNQEYKFAEYPNGFRNAKHYINYFEVLKNTKRVFSLKINRRFPNGEVIYDDDITVILEDFSVVDDRGEGFDVKVSLKFKEFKKFGAVVIKKEEDGGYSKKAERDKETAPSVPKKYVVKSGDTLWGIAKKYYGDGSRYGIIVIANSGSISNPNFIKVGQELVLPEK